MRELEQAAKERAAVVETVTAVLRHDLRNKLASIRNAAFYLSRRAQQEQPLKGDARVEQFFQLIDMELDAAEGLLEGPGARAPSPRTTARLRDVAEAALSRLPVPEGVRVERAWEDSALLTVDVEELTLLVRCLVENALEAMPEGGTLGLLAREDAEGSVLEVVDTGPGLAPEVAQKAFEPFVTTKPGHAGLGLCIARRLAQKYGARVRWKGGGEAARGTRMELRFPVRGA